MAKVTAMTMMVRLVASCRLGHATFRNSDLVSRRNRVTGFLLLPLTI